MEHDPVASVRAPPPKRLTPWWAWLLGAFFLTTFGFGVHGSLMGFGPVGAAVSDAPQGGVLIGRVVVGLPAERAGLHAGDVVLAVDGQPVRRAHDWDEMTWQLLK